MERDHTNMTKLIHEMSTVIFMILVQKHSYVNIR